MLLTGDNSRWLNRNRVWKEGWRNLHCQDPSVISADFVVEGVKGAATIHRSWAAGAEIDASMDWFQVAGRKRQPFA